MNRRQTVFVTGRGAVTSLGSTHAESMEAFRSGKVPSLITGEIGQGAYFASQPTGKHFPGLRTADTFSVRLAHAIGEAIGEAALTSEELGDTALIMNSITGSTHARESFLSKFLANGPNGLSPTAFIDSLISMAAGQVSMTFGIKGAASVLNGSNPLVLALDWLRQEREKRVIACSAEEYSPLAVTTRESYSQACGLSNSQRLGESATALILETRGNGPRLLGAATVGGWSCLEDLMVLDEPRSSEVVQSCTRLALEDASVNAREVTAITCVCHSDSPGAVLEHAAIGAQFPEATRLLHTCDGFGQTLGGAGLLATLVAIDALERDRGGVVIANSVEIGEMTSVVLGY